MKRNRRSKRTAETARHWRSALTVSTAGILVFLTLSGLAIYLLPFSLFSQTSVLTHTLVGLVALPLLLVYVWRHWRARGSGNLSHYQLLGYAAAVLLVACILSGLVVTWQGLFGSRMTAGWELAHLVTGLALPALVMVHLVTIVMRNAGGDGTQPIRAARRIFWVGSTAAGVVGVAATLAWAWHYDEPNLTRPFPDDYNWTFGIDRPLAPSLAQLGSDNGDWRETLDEEVLALLDESQHDAYRTAYAQVETELARYQHFAGHQAGIFERYRRALKSVDGVDASQMAAFEALLESIAERIRKHGALAPEALAGSERCGTCHEQIYQEWLPSAHRYSSMDDLFQVVQEIMAEETSPAHTRYCAGCHDPISLFGGAKNEGNITLSVEGAHEGVSCIGCHAITRADVQGNADFTLTPPRRYMYELDDGALARWMSDFLIRTYPEFHVRSYSRPLYKTAEYCGACHKQYMDQDLNTDIGRVQGQNQYDSWARSRWHVEGNPQETVNCRECHMPLVESTDPAAGDGHDYYRRPDDGMHRSHRFLGGNQYVPLLHDLEGAEEHVRLTEKWLRGEIDIPEIAHKWPDGPVVRMNIQAPEQMARGAESRFRVVLTNNKTGHDFPTGPLDMIESWLEVIVTDSQGHVLHHSGGLDARDAVTDPLVWFKADAFDREGELIDRHNLWDLVGKSYQRSLYPGVTDQVEVPVECPSVARRRLASSDGDGVEIKRTEEGLDQRIETFAISMPSDDDNGAVDQVHIEAVLWYRKANPDFLDTMYGEAARMRSPITEMTRVETVIPVVVQTGDDVE